MARVTEIGVGNRYFLVADTDALSVDDLDFPSIEFDVCEADMTTPEGGPSFPPSGKRVRVRTRDISVVMMDNRQ